MRVADAAVFEEHRLKHGSADALDDRTGDLVAQAVGIDDRAAVEALDHAHNLRSVAIDSDFSACGQVSALLEAAGDAEASRCCCRLLAPAKASGSRFEG